MDIKNLIRSINSKINKACKILKEEGLYKLINYTFGKIVHILRFTVRSKYLEVKRKNILMKYLNSLSQNEEVFFIIGGKRTWSYASSRAIKIPEHIAKRDKIVIYLYLDNEFLEDDFGDIEGVYYIPIRLYLKFIKKHPLLLKEYFRKFSKIYILIELPISEALNVIDYFDKHYIGHKIIYDIRDNWNEFKKYGEIGQFKPKVEEKILNKSHYVFTVSQKLKEIFENYHPNIIPNGFEPESFDKECKISLKKGEITIGYYGHLVPSWFDWNLILEVAKLKNKWIIHLIGTGGGNFIRNLPKNIIYHGKIEHKFLKAYAENWDVAIIPFKNSLISECSDPLKIYEYLYFGLPVVVQGIPHLSSYPFVYIGNGVHDFIKSIEDIVLRKHTFDYDKFKHFLSTCTWESRVNILLSYVEK